MPLFNPAVTILSPSIGTTVTGATEGSVLFAGAAGVLAQDNTNFFWDDSNNRLGIGTATPASKLHLSLADGGTNSVATVETLDHITSGTAANGFGAGRLWRLEDDGGTLRSAAQESVLWATAASGTRKTRRLWSVFDTAEREGLRLEADGANALLGIGGAVVAATRATLYTGADANTGLEVRANSGTQSGPLQTWTNSGGSVLALVDAVGRLGLGVGPGYRLQVRAIAGNVNLARFEDESGNGRWEMYGDTGNTFWLPLASTALNTTRDSAMFYIQTSYWDGAASVVEQVGMRGVRVHAGAAADNYAGQIFGHDNIVAVGWGPGGAAAVGYDAPNGAFFATLGQFHVRARAATTIGQTVMGAASQSANLFEGQKSDGTIYGTMSENGYWTTRKTSLPADGELVAGELAWSFDATNGASKAKFKGKSLDGTVVTGEVALA